MVLWYAKYRLSDNVVIAGGYVAPEDLEETGHGVTVGFTGPVPELIEPAEPENVYLKRYNETTQEIEDNV